MNVFLDTNVVIDFMGQREDLTPLSLCTKQKNKKGFSVKKNFFYSLIYLIKT